MESKDEGPGPSSRQHTYSSDWVDRSGSFSMNGVGRGEEDIIRDDPALCFRAVAKLHFGTDVFGQRQASDPFSAVRKGVSTMASHNI